MKVETQVIWDGTEMPVGHEFLGDDEVCAYENCRVTAKKAIHARQWHIDNGFTWAVALPEETP